MSNKILKNDSAIFYLNSINFPKVNKNFNSVGNFKIWDFKSIIQALKIPRDDLKFQPCDVDNQWYALSVIIANPKDNPINNIENSLAITYEIPQSTIIVIPLSEKIGLEQYLEHQKKINDLFASKGYSVIRDNENPDYFLDLPTKFNCCCTESNKLLDIEEINSIESQLNPITPAKDTIADNPIVEDTPAKDTTIQLPSQLNPIPPATPPPATPPPATPPPATPPPATPKRQINPVVVNRISEDSDLASEIIYAIRQDNPNAKDGSNNSLNNLKCPKCGKLSGFIKNKDKPWYFHCHHQKTCNTDTYVKDLYPYLFKNFAERYPQTKSDPHRPARKYLESRGLDTSLFPFEYSTYIGRHSVQFELNDNNETVLFCRRFFDYQGSDKVHFSKGVPTKGRYYQCIKENSKSINSTKGKKQIFLTEGIINCLSLAQLGYSSIALLTSNVTPKNFNFWNKDNEYIIAFDNDTKGIEAALKLKKFFTDNDMDYQIILPDRNKDWNDLLVSKQLTDYDFLRFFHFGNLLDSDTKEQYFDELYRYYGSAEESYSAIFEFNDITYHGKKEIKPDKKGNPIDKNTITKLLNCTLTIEHSILDDTVPNHESLEYSIIFNDSEHAIKRFKISGSDLASLSNFNSIISNKGRTSHITNSAQLAQYAEYLRNKTHLTIRELSAFGMDSKSNNFVLATCLYDKDGNRHEINNHQFFDKFNLQPLLSFQQDKIVKNFVKIPVKEFIDNLFGAYDYEGITAFGYYLATYFNNTIFNKYGCYPFLSIYGKAGLGKSSLVKRLNSMHFLKDYEGIPLNKVNTSKGESREISKFSSIPIPLLEGQDKSQIKTDLDSLLPLYNRNPLQIRAVKNNSNDTKITSFSGGLTLVWNNEQFNSPQLKERVISLLIDRNHNDLPKVKEFFDSLNACSPEEIASIGDSIFSDRNYYEANLIDRIDFYCNLLKQAGINNSRIALNHSIILAAITLFSERHNLDLNGNNQLVNFVLNLAENKKADNTYDTPEADLFLHFVNQLTEQDNTDQNRIGRLSSNWQGKSIEVYNGQNHAKYNGKQLMILSINHLIHTIKQRFNRDFNAAIIKNQLKQFSNFAFESPTKWGGSKNGRQLSDRMFYFKIDSAN